MDLLEKMATYVRVVEAGSFSAGAKQLRISPAAVSRQITTLEDELRVPLLRRTTRRMSITPAGRRYYERRLRVLREVDDAQAIGRTAATEGLLSVGAPVTSHLRLEVIGFDIQVNPARMGNFLNHDDQLIIAGSQLAVVEVIGWFDCLAKGAAPKPCGLVQVINVAIDQNAAKTAAVHSLPYRLKVVSARKPQAFLPNRIYRVRRNV